MTGVQTCALPISSYTSKTGNFSLGTSKDIFGLCWIWANYENSACKLSNFLNLTASTLIRVGWPSSLTNVTIYASSDYSTAKMAICNELCTRYSDELERHDSIPQARVWTTEIGNGTSSAPCLQYLVGNSLPDLVLTNCDSYNVLYLYQVHHEYTHYLHNIYTNDKDDFWYNVIASEIGSAVESTAISVWNTIFTKFSLDTNKYWYDFSNPYVDFTESLADWNSYIGLTKGAYGQNVGLSYKGLNADTDDYPNAAVFSFLINKSVLSADDVMDLVDAYDITTFAEFKKALLTEYSAKTSDIEYAFERGYTEF